MSAKAKNTQRQRLDKLLVTRGDAASREDAARLIESGAVSVAGLIAVRTSTMVAADAAIVVKHNGERWVSRGAHKLLRALDVFDIDVEGWHCVDIGASTGGFTQVLLARGAACVTAVDVGYGQLAWVLRNDPRVTVVERTNARYLTPEAYGSWLADLVTVDASFISLRTLLPQLETLLKPDGIIIALVKPQFEVGKEKIGKGVVRDPALHAEVLKGLEEYVAAALERRVAGAIWSPIKGPEGNIEFIFLLARAGDAPFACDWEELVAAAHEHTT